MNKKPNIDRKQKRTAKKLFIIGLGGFGAVSAIAVGTFLLLTVEMSRPLFVSPLASMKFAQASQTDNKIETLRKELKKGQIEFTSVEKTKEATYIVQLKQGGTVTFSAQKDIIAQIASLQFILSHLTMEGREFSKLDLRFEKPVIVFK